MKEKMEWISFEIDEREMFEEHLNDMSKQFENLFDDLSQNIDLNELNVEDLQNGGGIPLGSIFSNIFGSSKSENQKEDSGKKIKTEQN